MLAAVGLELATFFMTQTPYPLRHTRPVKLINLIADGKRFDLTIFSILIRSDMFITEAVFAVYYSLNGYLTQADI